MRTDRPFRRITRRAALLVGAAVLAGCRGRPSLGDIKDFDQRLARETLLAALEAWKQGRIADLAIRRPPIRLVDEDQASGAALVDFELAADANVRPFVTVPVMLTLRDRGGKIRRVAAGYQVTLQPQLAVLRADS